jgi:hypothetical protein
LRARVLEQLGADLNSHGITLCEASAGPSSAAPLAEIALELSGDSVLSLEVRDAVTDKRTLRDLRLGTVPRDALALSIALAAEELLHASWIEAALAPPPSTPAPPALSTVPQAVRDVDAGEVAKMPQVTRALGERASTAAPAGPSSTSTTVALLAAADLSTGGESDLGPDLRFAWGGRFAVGARAGFRESRDVARANGVVHGQELLAGAAVSCAFVPRMARWGGDVSLRADLVDVRFSGVPAPGATGASDSRLGSVVSAALGGWVTLAGPLRVVGEAAAGTPLPPVAATDAGQTATAISGITFAVALGLGINLQ